MSCEQEFVDVVFGHVPDSSTRETSR